MPPTQTATYDDRLAAALIRKRHDTPIRPLISVLAFNDLLDAAFCKEISRQLAEGDRRWEIHRATSDLWQQIPDRPGLYMFVLAPNLLLRQAHPEREIAIPQTLYVGRAGSASGSGTLRARYKSEYRHYVASDPERLWEESAESDRKATLRKYLNVAPLQYWYIEVANRDYIKGLEAALIKLLNPPLNIQGTLKMRPRGPLLPAF
jgi:hypothetical protein